MYVSTVRAYTHCSTARFSPPWSTLRFLPPFPRRQTSPSLNPSHLPPFYVLFSPSLASRTERPHSPGDKASSYSSSLFLSPRRNQERSQRAFPSTFAHLPRWTSGSPRPSHFVRTSREEQRLVKETSPPSLSLSLSLFPFVPKELFHQAERVRQAVFVKSGHARATRDGDSRESVRRGGSEGTGP